ncbi:MAG TPA: sulfite exporter TauE/SafE family protein [Gaiellaceae bacterium]|nr:sulfite exporter TauE/SafE family protein [Gaiellaceae bacterium]
MDALEAVAILTAGAGAGTINAVVGSGTLITFPVLLGFGYSPVTANVSNSLGLSPGSISGAIGYRRELTGQGRRALRLGLASIAGSVVGAILLLALPASAFKAIVPGFIALALVLVVLQSRITRALALHRTEVEHGGAPAWLGVFLSGIYGGYFGAAQGIILMAILGICIADTLQRLNALKNVLVGTANLCAAVIFAFAAPHLSWGAAGLVAAGSVVGGQIGARAGRKLPPTALRALIVAVGIVAIVKLVA